VQLPGASTYKGRQDVNNRNNRNNQIHDASKLGFPHTNVFSENYQFGHGTTECFAISVLDRKSLKNIGFMGRPHI
jgi:hypothetical protein